VEIPQCGKLQNDRRQSVSACYAHHPGRQPHRCSLLSSPYSEHCPTIFTRAARNACEMKRLLIAALRQLVSIACAFGVVYAVVLGAHSPSMSPGNEPAPFISNMQADKPLAISKCRQTATWTAKCVISLPSWSSKTAIKGTSLRAVAYSDGDVVHLPDPLIIAPAHILGGPHPSEITLLLPEGAKFVFVKIDWPAEGLAAH
jgi:hypothetical protein